MLIAGWTCTGAATRRSSAAIRPGTVIIDSWRSYNSRTGVQSLSCDGSSSDSPNSGDKTKSRGKSALEKGNSSRFSRRMTRKISNLHFAATSFLKKPYYATTPIFYPNAKPHIGHLYSLIVTDIYARYAALSRPSIPVKLVTGTDEHGMKIQQAAKAQGLNPDEFCEILGLAFHQLAQSANVSFTNFVRTSNPSHKAAVQHLWNKLCSKGLIYKGSHAGWYSVSDETFYTDSQICSKIDAKSGQDIRASIETNNVVEWTKEENYKFKLSEFKESLKNHYETFPFALQPSSQKEIVMSILRSNEPLLDLSVSRPSSRLTWGVPVPGDDTQTIYVWLDALASYLTGIGYPWRDSRNMIESGWPVDLQVIGKDILRFHAIIFPAVLLALDLPLPRALLSHAHWTVENVKMSKSIGNVVNPMDVIKEHGIDTVRWYLARVGGRFNNDVDWSNAQLLKHEREIASLVGNTLLRMQAPKIVDKLPERFRDIPLHRAILFARVNAPEIQLPGTEQYDDLAEDRNYYAAEKNIEARNNADFATEYVQSCLGVKPLNEFDILYGRSRGVQRFSPRQRFYSPRPHAGSAIFGSMLRSRADSRIGSRLGHLNQINNGIKQSENSPEEVPIISIAFRQALHLLRGRVVLHMQRFEVAEATDAVVNVLNLCNKEITRIAPWSPKVRLFKVLHCVVWARETLRICGILIQPFVPNIAGELLDALRVHPCCRSFVFARIGSGRVRPGPPQRRILVPSRTEREKKLVEEDHKSDEKMRMQSEKSEE